RECVVYIQPCRYDAWLWLPPQDPAAKPPPNRRPLWLPLHCAAARQEASLRFVPRQPNPQKKEQHQENYHSSLLASFSPYCSLIKGTKTVQVMLARRAANVPGGSTFTLGGATYTSDPANPITGTGRLDFVKAAPTAMVGFGNLVPESRHFTFNFEMGAVFQGSARTKLNLTGGACDATGLYCVNAATDPTVQANVAAEQNKINNKLSPFKYYPVVSFGFGYRF